MIPLFFGASGGSSITTSGNWTVTSTNQTLTVPGGSGTVKFTSVVADSGNAQYSKNNGTFTTYVENDTLAVATNDTLKFRTSTSDGLDTTVIDNATGATVGTVGF